MGCLKLYDDNFYAQEKGVGGLYVGYKKGCAESYRFGFNGQEKVDEIAGSGNHNTALFWEYDTRLGRRWNVDPESKKLPSVSPYCVMVDNPIRFNDPKGDIVPAILALLEGVTFAETVILGATVATGAWMMYQAKEHPIDISYHFRLASDATRVATLPVPDFRPKIVLPSKEAIAKTLETVVVGTLALSQLKKGYYEVTYSSVNDEGKIYIGRTSGFGTPQELVNKRMKGHHRNSEGFVEAMATLAIPSVATIPRNISNPAYMAIRVAENTQIAAVPAELSPQKPQIRGIAEKNMPKFAPYASVQEYINPISGFLNEYDD